jgi:TPR repeat protein
MYSNGVGVQVDHRKAAEYYRMAAENGFCKAQVRGGISHTGAQQRHCQLTDLRTPTTLYSII